MNVKLKLALAAIVFAAQIATPAWMIADQEITLRTGSAWKFKTRPIDPYDPFRGRFVTLAFEAETIPDPEGPELDYQETVYGVLTENEEGFAEFARLLTDPPEDGSPHIRAEVSWVDTWSTETQRTVHLTLPFDRFYMNERLAPEAEAAMRNRAWGDPAGGGPVEAWALVRVRNGRGVIEDLFIGGKPVYEYLLSEESEGEETVR